MAASPPTNPRYYVVVDLEATCDEHHAIPREETEIIEIGAVLVDGPSLRPVAELQTFVRPTLHTRLTAFCTKLTTITQADVDHAPLFPDAAARLAAFGANALFCSWGKYDKTQLARDAGRHGIPSPLGPDHMNIKEEFTRARSLGRGIGIDAALANVGLTLLGTHHRGIDDARNIARLLPYVVQ